MTKICLTCKQVFDHKLTRIKFCSKICYWKSLKGKMPKNTSGLVLGHGWNKNTKGLQVAWNKGLKTGFLGGGVKKGNIPWNKNKTGLQKAWNKGVPALWARGKNNTNWKGGITPINHAIRTSLEYKMWRREVLKRDNYTCQLCGQKGGQLRVDHWKYPFWAYPGKRTDLENGRALCKNCNYLVTYKEKNWEILATQP